MDDVKDLVVTERPDGALFFNRPYTFEDKEFTHIDLSGADDLTARDLVEAEKLFTSKGGMATMPELNIQYCMIVASKATGKPVEFFELLPAREMLKIKNHLVAHFFGGGD